MSVPSANQIISQLTTQIHTQSFKIEKKCDAEAQVLSLYLLDIAKTQTSCYQKVRFLAKQCKIASFISIGISGTRFLCCKLIFINSNILPPTERESVSKAFAILGTLSFFMAVNDIAFVSQIIRLEKQIFKNYVNLLKSCIVEQNRLLSTHRRIIEVD